MSLWSSIGRGIQSVTGFLFGQPGGDLGNPSVSTPAEPFTLFGAPPLSGLAHDAIWNTVFPQPWYGPGEVDNYGDETPAMRLLYREAQRKEPAVVSAIEGKVNAIASLDLSVRPGDRKNERSCLAAEFVKWSLKKSKKGTHGLIRDILAPGFVDGWSLNEIKLRIVDGSWPTDEPQWHGMWTLEHLRNLDTIHLRLQLDQYRNVRGIINLIRGIQRYEPAKCILYTHNGMFNNPFGQSDLRSVVRAVKLIEDAYRAWYIAIKRFGLPYVIGQVEKAEQRVMMEAAVSEMYATGYAVTGPKDKIDVLNLASASSFSAFEAKVRALREDVFLAIRGVYLPFLEGQGGTGAHGDTSIHKASSDSQEDVLRLDAMHLINTCLVPYLVRPNFGMDVALPEVSMGGTNWPEAKQRLDVTKGMKEMGLPVSKTEVYESMSHTPPEDPDDSIGGPESGGQSDLRGTVGGLQAISALQTSFYGGQIPQAAAVAALRLLFGFAEEDALQMFPPVKPVNRTDQGQGGDQQPAPTPPAEPALEPTTFSAEHRDNERWKEDADRLIAQFRGVA